MQIMNRTQFKFCLLPLVLSFLLLSACSDKLLDFRNAQINNGRIYAGNSDTPFSGRVTNIPAGKIFGYQQGYANLLKAVNAARPRTTLSEMGVSSMCDVQAHDGTLNGKVVCKTEQSDIVRIEANFTSGMLDGAFKIRDESGSRTFVELSFKQGSTAGTMKIYGPLNGKLAHIVNWEAGVMNGEEEGFDETTGNRLFHATLVDGKYDGQFIVYGPDGKHVIRKTGYAHGLFAGDQESFDPQTGIMTGQAHYLNGKLDGIVRHWNADGSLNDEKTYKDGVEVVTAESQSVDDAAGQGKIDRCVEGWTTAYRRENGADALVSADQMGEWKTWCSAGKQAT